VGGNPQSSTSEKKCMREEDGAEKEIAAASRKGTMQTVDGRKRGEYTQVRNAVASQLSL